VSFLIIDFYYIIWLTSLKERIPSFISAGFLQASLGVLDFFYEKLGKYLDTQRLRRANEVTRSRHELYI
jgi:hypothetical protein